MLKGGGVLMCGETNKICGWQGWIGCTHNVVNMGRIGQNGAEITQNRSALVEMVSTLVQTLAIGG